ncbi:MASE1 domain-containing sensor histidine kinase [Frateuria defendens]|uniref:MASE1 domain-containing sensor histidine kinase n=1 Tax=Frateuria defendens TaxID=2219559 RepID=UPI00066FFE96|nr:MASE1 domain-containing protein [Frateuria defendens]
MQPRTLTLPESGPLLGAAYVALWLLLRPTEHLYWILPFGLRFSALLLVPMRQWFWLLGPEIAATAVIDLHAGMPLGWIEFLAGDLPQPLVVAIGLGLLRRANLHASLRTPEDTTRLLLSAVLVVAATTATDAVLLSLLHDAETSGAMAQMLGQSMLGDYLGVLLVAPLLVMLLRAPPSHKALASLVMDGMLVMLPAIAILLMLSRHAAPQPQFARVLSLAPVLFFAFRHGWRGACLSLLVTNLSMAVADFETHQVAPSATSYLFLAVAGTGALMLGSASDALRRSSERVSEQNVYLGAVNRRLDQLARQLRDAARGNLHAEETQRRHMAAELHDELGQNITAIQTHIKLAQARMKNAGLEDVSLSLNLILAHMRRALHRLLDDLRPAVLDEFGLFRALDEGPIRDLLATAGIVFVTDFHGDPRLLDDDTRTAIYRLVQESATNTVKHARASEFRLRLRIGPRHGTMLALLDIRDDGIGLPPRLPRGGHGLQGMRDRVTSLGGLFRLRPGVQGTHLRIMLRSNHGTSDAGRLA